jgi:hypothetical protein
MEPEPTADCLGHERDSLRGFLFGGSGDHEGAKSAKVWIDLGECPPPFD